MREKDLTAAVHALENRLVLLVRAAPPKADEREPERRGDLPREVGLDPVGEQPGEADVLAMDGAKPLGAVAAQHCPQLEGTEAPAERGTVLGERIRVLRRAQELRDERERLAKLVGPRRPQ